MIAMIKLVGAEDRAMWNAFLPYEMAAVKWFRWCQCQCQSGKSKRLFVPV
jgi:hypothetical protein